VRWVFSVEWARNSLSATAPLCSTNWCTARVTFRMIFFCLTSHEQLQYLRDQRHANQIDVVVVVLVTRTNSSENCVARVVRALLINDPDKNFDRGRAAALVLNL